MAPRTASKHLAAPALIFSLSSCGMALCAVPPDPSTETDEQWIQARLASALSDSGPLASGNPVLIFNDADHVEVTDAGQILFGNRLASRLRAAPDAVRLANFLLLHELRHIQQLSIRMDTGKRYRECDADFHASLQTGRSVLGRAGGEDAVNPALAEVMTLQGLGAAAAALSSDKRSHDHLLPSERFSIGAHAIWRSVDEWSTRPGIADDDRYTALRLRARTFVEPQTQTIDEWVATYCAALADSPGRDAAFISMELSGGDISTDGEQPDDMLVFVSTYVFKNRLNRDVRILGWPLHGYREAGRDPPPTSFVATSGGYYDVVVPARGEATVSIENLSSIADLVALEPFSWDSPSTSTELVFSAVAQGDPVEPANCARHWKAPKDAEVAAFMSFVLRAGALAHRAFHGMISGERNAGLALDTRGPRTYYWRSLPPPASPMDSYVALGSWGLGAYGRIELEPRSQADAAAIYAAHSMAVREGCESGVKIVERERKDGGRELAVEQLSIQSRATLSLSRDADKEDPSRTRYAVEWIISPID